MDRRVFRLLERSILETAAVIIGSLGSGWRVIFCKLGQSVGKVVTTEAIAEVADPLGRLNPSNARSMVVVLGEMKEGMDEIASSVMRHKWRTSRFGSNGSLQIAQSH